VTLTPPELGAYIVVLARAGALAATAPVIGDPGVPMRARLIFVLAITAAIGSNRTPVPFDDLPVTAVLELAIGLMTGLCARFVMARMAIAGQLMGLSLGLGFASQFDVYAGESAGVLRSLTTALAGLAFLEVGGLEATVRSVASGPVHVGQLVALGPELLRHATSAFTHGLTLAAPIMLAALVGNIGLAVMNRAAPAINMFSIALGAVLLVGGAILIATAAGLAGSALDTARDAATQLLGG
jgi:flagellar biosynthetic protein FliR